MISAIVFDFDGVLVDSEPLHLRAYQEVLEPFGLSLLREKYYASYLGFDDAGVFRAVAEAREWPLDERKLRALIDEKCRVYDGCPETVGDIMYRGAAECVARLAAVWPLGIASGAARPEIETMLKGRGLDRLLPLHRRVWRNTGQQARTRSVSQGRRPPRPSAGDLRRDRGFALGHRVGQGRGPLVHRDHAHLSGLGTDATPTRS